MPPRANRQQEKQTKSSRFIHDFKPTSLWPASGFALKDVSCDWAVYQIESHS
jgi:hypothetical protein